MTPNGNHFSLLYVLIDGEMFSLIAGRYCIYSKCIEVYVIPDALCKFIQQTFMKQWNK